MTIIGKDALNLESAAARLDIHPRRLKALRKAGKIGAIQVGGGEMKPRFIFPVREIESFLERECRTTSLPASELRQDGTSSGLKTDVQSAARRARLIVERQRLSSGRSS